LRVAIRQAGAATGHGAAQGYTGTGLFGSLAESLATLDTPRAIAAAKHLGETVAAQDAPASTALAKTGAIAETIHPADAPARTLAAAKTLAESISPADAPHAAGAGRHLVESVVTQDAPVSAGVTLSAALTETIHPADAESHTLAANKIVAESVQTSDIIATGTIRILSDAVAVTEQLAAVQHQVAQLTESVAVQDAPWLETRWTSHVETVRAIDWPYKMPVAFVETVTEMVATDDASALGTVPLGPPNQSTGSDYRGYLQSLTPDPYA
jgi:hypothetical protein